MRADGTAPADVEVAVGATMPAPGTLVAVLLAAGGILLLLSLTLVLGSVFAGRGRTIGTQPGLHMWAEPAGPLRSAESAAVLSGPGCGSARCR